ncbi:hypothetical protein V8G54_003863 [Vigna mungo]|uniref:Uncharacterized protein n=1 Tax=Vigna mungo TaxID=3915 RepID=A0AAQ3PDJ3_VIGMU
MGEASAARLGTYLPGHLNLLASLSGGHGNSGRRDEEPLCLWLCDFVRVDGAVAVVWNVVEKRRFLLLSAILGRERDYDVYDEMMNNWGLRLEVVFRTLIDSWPLVNYAALLCPSLSRSLGCFRDH